MYRDRKEKKKNREETILYCFTSPEHIVKGMGSEKQKPLQDEEKSPSVIYL